MDFSYNKSYNSFVSQSLFVCIYSVRFGHVTLIARHHCYETWSDGKNEIAGVTRWWVNNNKTVIFEWTIPFTRTLALRKYLKRSGETVVPIYSFWWFQLSANLNITQPWELNWIFFPPFPLPQKLYEMWKRPSCVLKAAVIILFCSAVRAG